MASIESASALITGISLAVTATGLVLNILNNRDDIDIGRKTILFSVLFIFASFYTSIAYLYAVQFQKLIFFPQRFSQSSRIQWLFGIAAGFSLLGIAIPILRLAFVQLRSN